MKKCVTCGENPRYNKTSYCKSCRNEYQKAYYKKNTISIMESSKRRITEIRDFIKQFKNKPCMDCGIIYPYYVMDLDHVTGKKKFNLGVAGSKVRSLDTIKKEIDKCELVCSNCHRIRTFSRTLLK